LEEKVSEAEPLLDEVARQPELGEGTREESKGVRERHRLDGCGEIPQKYHHVEKKSALMDALKGGGNIILPRI